MIYLMNKRSKVLVLVLVFVLILSSIAFAAPNEKAAVAFDKKVLARIDADKALEHIKYLSEKIGPRVAATEEEREAAEYISNQFEKSGYSPEIQKFNYEATEATVVVAGLDLPATGGTGSAYTEITGTLVNCGFGLELTEFPDAVEGKIAFIERGQSSFANMAANAMEKGAIGVLVFNRATAGDDDLMEPWVSDDQIDIPFAFISKKNGTALRERMAAGEELTATISVEEVTKESQNVVAVRKPKKSTGKEGIIYVTAHYDSVPGAPGANDNASGTAMMLEFAKILKSYQIDKEIRFIACGAEEVGLFGSYAYVDQLSEEELERSVANFNMDMIATSAEQCDILYVDTVDGEPNLVTDAAIAAGARLGNDVLKVNYGESSDHAPFGYVNIPATCFIWGDEDGNLEAWYHTPNDTIKMNISLERLQKAGEIIGSALYDTIRVEKPNLYKSAIRRLDSAEIHSLGRIK